jgi:hypothetical protein
MASIWWVAVAFLAGGFGGAILVALMSINARDEDGARHPLDPADDTQAAAAGLT